MLQIRHVALYSTQFLFDQSKETGLKAVVPGAENAEGRGQLVQEVKKQML